MSGRRRGSALSAAEARFSATVGVAGRAGWQPAADFLALQLGETIKAERRLRETASDAVAGSLFTLEYSRRLSWPAVAAQLRDGAWLDPGIDNVQVRLEEDGRTRLGFVAGPRRVSASLLDVVRRLVGSHLELVVDTVHEESGAGRRVLWSNIAAALAGALLAMSWGSSDRSRYVETAREALAVEPRLAGLVTASVVDHAGERWMRTSRHGCCLAFRCGPRQQASYCGTCPILDEAEQLHRFRRAATHYKVLESAASESRSTP